MLRDSQGRTVTLDGDVVHVPKIGTGKVGFAQRDYSLITGDSRPRRPVITGGSRPPRYDPYLYYPF